MAAKASKGSIILEILIVLMALLLIAVILVPNKLWEEEAQVTTQCRTNMNNLAEAEQFYFRANNIYTDSLSKVLTYIQADSGLKQRQSLVSLTRSFTQVIQNILNIDGIDQISNISQSVFEITGDLVGNERYFRSYPEIDSTSKEILREMSQFDSSAAIPNFNRTKLFVDSLRRLYEKISDYSLQNSVLHASSYVDSVNIYYPDIERDNLIEFWNNERTKFSDFIAAVNATDIVKVSSVTDRLQKFIERISTGINNLGTENAAQDKKQLEAERQNLTELHQRFLAPEYFMLTKRYGLTALNETDSILINLDQANFYCPDDKQIYLVDTTKGNHLVVECPNLLDRFHEKFMQDVEPVRNLPFYSQMDQIDTVLQKTKNVLNENRNYLRRYTDVLLQLKEVSAEMNDVSNVFFYNYTHEMQDFLKTLDNNKGFSTLKPAIEGILNPMDTLATRIETGNISDLSTKLEYFRTSLKQLDSATATLRLSSRVRKEIKSATDTLQPAFGILDQMKADFSPSYAQALREASEALEKDLLHGLEGVTEAKYVIFRKRHINHGYIENGEKSWEKK